jgi:hypothetical protein
MFANTSSVIVPYGIIYLEKQPFRSPRVFFYLDSSVVYEEGKSRRNITIRNVVSRQVHHKPHIDWNLDDIDHTKAMMMIIAVIMIESMIILTSRMIIAIMITIMTMIMIRIDRHVSLGNEYVRTSAFTLEQSHTISRAASKVIYPNASCALCRKPAIWHEFSSLTSPPAVQRVSQNRDSRESEP